MSTSLTSVSTASLGKDILFKDLLAKFEEGKKYEFTPGALNLWGKGFVTKKNNVLQIDIPIFILGAFLFGQTTLDEVKLTNRYNKDLNEPRYFKNGVRYGVVQNVRKAKNFLSKRTTCNHKSSDCMQTLLSKLKTLC